MGITFLNRDMDGYMYYHNASGRMGDPVKALEYYNYMRATWRDGIHLQYGGDGHTLQTYGPDCKYFAPGSSDSLLKGTNGKLPNGPLNWTEALAKNPPYCNRGLGSVGPLTFVPGETKLLDLAFVWARDYTGKDTAMFSVPLLFDRIADVREFYKNNLAGKTGEMVATGVNSEIYKTPDVHIYPNPAKDKIYIMLSDNSHAAKYTIFSLLGTKVAEDYINSNRNLIPINNLNNGMYIITINQGINSFTRKIIIQKEK